MVTAISNPSISRVNSHQNLFSIVGTSKTGSILASHALETPNATPPSLLALTTTLERTLQAFAPIRGIILGIESDPLTPTRLQTTLDCMNVFISKGLKVWLQTNQLLDMNLLETLVRTPDKIHLILPFGIPKPLIQEEAHPDNTSTPARWRQLATLKHLGIPLDIRLSHITPGNDTRRILSPIFRELSYRGFTKVFCSYDFHPMNSTSDCNLPQDWRKTHQEEKLPYFGNCLLYAKKIRSRGYSRIMSLGHEAGIQVQIDQFSNPDFVKPLQHHFQSQATNLKQKYLTLTGHQIREEMPMRFD